MKSALELPFNTVGVGDPTVASKSIMSRCLYKHSQVGLNLNKKSSVIEQFCEKFIFLYLYRFKGSSVKLMLCQDDRKINK